MSTLHDDIHDQVSRRTFLGQAGLGIGAAALSTLLPFALRGTIKQDGVFPGFRMPVPIRVRFKDQPPKVYHVWVDAESVDVDLLLPAQPVGVDFNLQHAVLARVK